MNVNLDRQFVYDERLHDIQERSYIKTESQLLICINSQHSRNYNAKFYIIFSKTFSNLFKKPITGKTTGFEIGILTQFEVYFRK